MTIIQREEALSSFLKYFDDHFSATGHVQWPGQNFDTMDVDEWVRPVLGAIQRDPVRRGARDVARTGLVVECFARFGTNAYRADELADAAAHVLNQATIPVHDYDAGSTPVGYLLVGEARVGEAASPDAAGGSRLVSITVTADARLEAV